MESTGTSNQCAPCRQCDEQRSKRHREIAELLLKLDNLNSNMPSTPLTPRHFNTLDSTLEESSMTKKERKAAKKAKKISEMPKSVDTAAIERVSNVLYPKDGEDEELELEARLLDDADINLNRFFHKGTSNVREVRNGFIVKKDRRAGKTPAFHVDAEQINGLLQLLNVSPVAAGATPETRKTFQLLKEKIEADLLQAQEEMAGTMMRKAGFWRWASKKAYNRLVAHGRIWDHRGCEVNGAKTKESESEADGRTGSSNDVGHSADETDITEPDTDLSPNEQDIATSMSTLTVETLQTPKTPTAPKHDVEDGWTSVAVGKKSKAKKTVPAINIKLSHNGGLAKMVQSSTPKTARILGFHKEDD